MKKLRVEASVLESSPDEIKVEISPPDECSSCSCCAYSKKRKITVPVKKSISPGERVTLAVDCSNLAGMSFLAYFIPSVFLVMGFILGYFLWGNAGGLAGAILLLAAGSFITGRLSLGKYRSAVQVEQDD